jgi:hypothetical protein
MRRPVAIATGALCLLVAGAALAADEEPSQAEVLFKDGLEAMRSKNYAEACPKLEESYRLDPLPGALFTLAECQAAAGKSATAIKHYQDFVNGLTALPPDRRDSFDERRRIALDKITALSALAPEITIDVAAGAPQTLIVKRNDEVVDPGSYGVGKKVDRGSYAVSATLDGKLVWQKRFELSERDRARVEVPWPLPKGAPEKESKAEVKPAPKPLPPPSSAGPSRTWMYVSAGVGAAGLLTGVVAGVVALGKKGDIEDNCPNRVCNAEGRDAVDSGQSAALVSSIGFAVGIAGAGATAALFFLTKKAPEDHAARRRITPTLAVSRESGTLGIEGAF